MNGARLLLLLCASLTWTGTLCMLPNCVCVVCVCMVCVCVCVLCVCVCGVVCLCVCVTLTDDVSTYSVEKCNFIASTNTH